MKFDSAAACRFFTPDDAVRWALAAYYGASRALAPPPGELFFSDGAAWSSPAVFALDVQSRFTELMVSAAIDAKIPCDHGSVSPSCSWDDSGFPGSHADFLAASFSAPELNTLPPVENVGNNPSDGALRHG